MTNDQRNFCNELLTLSYHYGFRLFPLPLLEKRLGLPPTTVYWNECQRNGVLWDLHPLATGPLRGALVFRSDDSGSSGAASLIGINPDMRQLLEERCGYRRSPE